MTAPNLDIKAFAELCSQTTMKQLTAQALEQGKVAEEFSQQLQQHAQKCHA